MRLIDADALAKSFKDCHVGVYRIGRLAQEIIDKQPTVYDTEKVVAELEKAKMIYFLTIANTGDEKHDFAYCEVSNAINKAIYIVKRGGVE